ncbi:hypothetical protein [Mucilaginibacter pedocola]|uniref:Outer membrane protein beta-barrel domain-containing protein n=1 Tax=Mucilaginibacter pedocola TaxID=1792845 RepID=A0A1S9PBU3_9SPHI|nr:hypothetical protein [Mucilaginibacter pedocola]OOQ58425.1 hypothetical protein BC343_07020 [Mucilaginibacter pedocola]
MKEELIDHIRTQLTEFEVGYRDGAWERFNRQQGRRRRVVFWTRLAGAAAILLCILRIIVPWVHQDGVVIQNHPQAQANRIRPVTPIAEQQHSPPARAVAVSRIIKKARPTVAEGGALTEETPGRLTDSLNSMRPLLAAMENPGPMALQVAGPFTESGHEEKIPPGEKQEVRTGVRERASGKWRLAFAFGQAMDNRLKADIGLGLDIAYKATGRLSISAGVHFNQLGGGFRDRHPDLSTSTGKVLTGSQASLQGIEIPFGLEIKASSRLYAHAGISAYAVTGQRQHLDYTEQKTTVNTYVDPDGNMRSETVTVNEFSTESVPEEQLRRRSGVFGLYNFAIGWRQQVAKKYAVSIEPFVKVPLSRYSDQNLNLVQGGLRLKVDL